MPPASAEELEPELEVVPDEEPDEVPELDEEVDEELEVVPDEDPDDEPELDEEVLEGDPELLLLPQPGVRARVEMPAVSALATTMETRWRLWATTILPVKCEGRPVTTVRRLNLRDKPVPISRHDRDNRRARAACAAPRPARTGPARGRSPARSVTNREWASRQSPEAPCGPPTGSRVPDAPSPVARG